MPKIRKIFTPLNTSFFRWEKAGMKVSNSRALNTYKIRRYMDANFILFTHEKTL